MLKSLLCDFLPGNQESEFAGRCGYRTRATGSTARIAHARASSSSSSFVWHSQIVKTCHPRAFSLSTVDASLALLAANFACQNSGRVAGVVAYGHPGCWCQKQPCTNIATLRPDKTRSGRPGRDRSWRRNRIPTACRYRLTLISGWVLPPWMAPIILDRTSGVTVSAKCCSSRIYFFPFSAVPII